MTRNYFTFGQTHTHRVDGVTFDCDSVVLIHGDPGHARALMFEKFGPKWAFHYTRTGAELFDMRHFPRGVVKEYNA